MKSKQEHLELAKKRAIYLIAQRANTPEAMSRLEIDLERHPETQYLLKFFKTVTFAYYMNGHFLDDDFAIAHIKECY